MVIGEEQILAAPVGERRPHDGTIPFSEYDNDWPAQFERLEE